MPAKVKVGSLSGEIKLFRRVVPETLPKPAVLDCGKCLEYL